MPVKFVDRIGGLDQRSPQDIIDPANAVEAQYIDPMRGEGVEVSSCYGFKTDTPADLPSNWDGSTLKVLAAFNLGDYECYITGQERGDTPDYWNIRLWYIDENNVMQEPDLGGENENHCEVIPSRIFIDPNVHTIGTPGVLGYAEYYQVYLFGWSEGYGYGNQPNYNPKRIILKKELVQNTPVWVWEAEWLLVPCNFEEWGSFVNFYVYQDNDDASFDSDYEYILVLEDRSGNLINMRGDAQFERHYDASVVNKSSRIIVSQVNNTDKSFQQRMISKVHIYRSNLTDAEADGLTDTDEKYDRARWVGTKEVTYGSGSILMFDTDGSEARLGDYIYPGRLERQRWMTNIDKFRDVAILHNGAFWFAKDQAAIFSEYTLNAPLGARFLNLPSVNRWVFGDVGEIVELESQDNKLVVFGTEGIAEMSGTHLDNFYVTKISDVGIPKYDPRYREYHRTVTKIGERIYFLSHNGKPYFYERGSVYEIRGPLVAISGTVTEYTQPEIGTIAVTMPVEATRYRDAWMITNGSTIYVYDTRSNRWFEWPENVRCFVTGLETFYEKATVATDAAAEYDYFRFIDEDGLPRVYATDGTYPTVLWKTPKMIFGEDQKFTLIVFHWRYDSELPYGEKDQDSASRTAEAPEGTLSVFLDDRQTLVKSYNLKFSQNSDGEYRFALMVSLRGRKFAWQLSMSAAKYFKLTGWELKHEGRSRKAFA